MHGQLNAEVAKIRDCLIGEEEKQAMGTRRATGVLRGGSSRKPSSLVQTTQTVENTCTDNPPFSGLYAK